MTYIQTDKPSMLRMLERQITFANEAFLTGRMEDGIPALAAVKDLMANMQTLEPVEHA